MFLLVFEDSDIGASSPSRCSQKTHDVISYWGHSTLPQNSRSVRDALQKSAKKSLGLDGGLQALR